jgi:hypothetical protein
VSLEYQPKAGREEDPTIPGPLAQVDNNLVLSQSNLLNLMAQYWVWINPKTPSL